jgi:hypothetical protein
MSTATIPALRRRTLDAFRLAGLTLTASAMKVLVSTLRRGGYTAGEIDAILAQVLSAPELQASGGSIVQGDTLAAVVDRLGRDAEVGPGGLVVMDAREAPRYSYHAARNKFAMVEGCRALGACVFFFFFLNHFFFPRFFRKTFFVFPLRS